MGDKTKSRAAFELAGQRVAAGSLATLHLDIPQLYTDTTLRMPVKVVHGRRPGPVLLLTAAVHGDEINGVEIIRRVLASRSVARLRGTLIAVPVVNVYGFINKTRYLPDRRDLNRSCPGSEKGSLTARLAHRVVSALISRASHLIDLHTAAIHRLNLPQVRVCLDDPASHALALAFQAPVIVDAELRDGSLREAARELGVASIVYEGGEALRFNELAIRAGVRGVLSTMRHLGMLRATREAGRGRPFIAQSTRWVRAPVSGVLRTFTDQRVAVVDRGQLLATISDPFGIHETPVTSTVSGVVIGRTTLPLVNEGDALYHIARTSRTDAVETQLMQHREELSADHELGDSGANVPEPRSAPDQFADGDGEVQPARGHGSESLP